MRELKFKTTLSCSGCLSKVQPGLDEIAEIDKWEVDLGSPDKILTVQTSAEVKDKIEKVFTEKGFEAVEL